VTPGVDGRQSEDRESRRRLAHDCREVGNDLKTGYLNWTLRRYQPYASPTVASSMYTTRDPFNLRSKASRAARFGTRT
jgi:hypothetical protein